MSSVTELPTWPRAVELFQKMLYHFYRRSDRPRAIPYGLKLLRALHHLDPRAASIPGNEYRAVIAELDEDLADAIRYRLREIRLYEKLIRRGQLESSQLTWDRYADRYDLLASLYMDAREWDKACAAIRKSERICQEHEIPFDGEALKADIATARETAAAGPKAKTA